MVLVDTSVWVRFLYNREPYASGLDQLLSRDDVVGHDFVYGELMLGARGGRAKLLSDYVLMHRGPVVRHEEVVQFARDRRLDGRGIGWVDTHLLASAVVGHFKLWSADACLLTLATEFGVAYS
jgi:predicted nucleic acid-binding protein